jgi:hypothetical protein
MRMAVLSQFIEKAPLSDPIMVPFVLLMLTHPMEIVVRLFEHTHLSLVGLLKSTSVLTIASG